MEDKSKPIEQTTDSVEEKKDTKVAIEKTVVIDGADDAGPSRIHLPGAIATPKVHRTGLSKSEHSIHLITNQDVSNALKLTSLSFAKNNAPPTSINFNFKDLKIPLFKKNNDAQQAKVDNRDMKKLVASCLKFNRETPVSNLPEVPVAIQTNVVRNEVQEMPNSSITAVTANAQTDDTFIVKKPNEVIVTTPGALEAKQSKDKKKPGNLSERSDLGLATRDSLSSIGSNVCRICMTRGRERLISPCNCKGSLANVHLSCLERWLNQVGRNHCELCGYSYPAIRTPRYTVLQALRLWFGNPRNRSHLQSDCLIFWLLSTVTAGLLAVCIVGTQYFAIEGKKFGKAGASLRKEEETAMDFFMAVVLCGYSVTVYLLWKDHYVMWNRWRRANVNVRLLLSPDANPVPFVPRSERPRYSVV